MPCADRASEDSLFPSNADSEGMSKDKSRKTPTEKREDQFPSRFPTSFQPLQSYSGIYPLQ